MPEFRRDPVTGGWVIFAPERSRRPSDFFSHPAGDDAPTCPFCPGRDAPDDPPPRVVLPPGPGYEDQPWSARVIRDKFPLLSEDEDFDRWGEGMYDVMAGYGAHELVIESPVHGERFDDFSEEHLREILSLYQQRILELTRNRRVAQVLITRNIGHDAGAHIHHPHSHVVALPIVPKKIGEELEGARRYFEYKERCIFCDVVAQERHERSRVVLENDSFLAFCPYASRFPFEVTIIPREHLVRFEAIHPREVADLATMMKRLIGGLTSLLRDPPLNYIVHSAPTVHARRIRGDGSGSYYHWHIEILPKLTRVAGFEWGSGFYINPMLPEDAAHHLRDAVGSADGTGSGA